MYLHLKDVLLELSVQQEHLYKTNTKFNCAKHAYLTGLRLQINP